MNRYEDYHRRCRRSGNLSGKIAFPGKAGHCIYGSRRGKTEHALRSRNDDGCRKSDFHQRFESGGGETGRYVYRRYARRIRQHDRLHAGD